MIPRGNVLFDRLALISELFSFEIGLVAMNCKRIRPDFIGAWKQLTVTLHSKSMAY